MSRININISTDKARTYKTEASLMKALEKKKLDNTGCRFFVCCNSDGRFTAVFLVTEWMNQEGGYAGLFAQHGFASV